MKIQAVASKRGNGFREFGGIRILDGFRNLLGLLMGPVKGREWGFNAETALAAAAFGGGFFWGGEGEETDGYYGTWWRMAVVQRSFSG